MFKAIATRTAQNLRTSWKQHLITLALAWVAIVAVDTWRTRDLPQGPAPDVALLMAPTHAGAGTPPTHNTTLAQWRALHPGQPVAVHFWAEWCSICKLEEPSIASLSADWPVLGVAMQSGNAERVAQVQRQRGMPWQTAVDPQGALSRSWGGALRACAGRHRCRRPGAVCHIRLHTRMGHAPAAVVGTHHAAVGRHAPE